MADAHVVFMDNPETVFVHPCFPCNCCMHVCLYKGPAGSPLLCETHLLATAIIPSASPREFANIATSAQRVSPYSKVHKFVPLGVLYVC